MSPRLFRIQSLTDASTSWIAYQIEMREWEKKFVVRSDEDFRASTQIWKQKNTTLIGSEFAPLRTQRKNRVMSSRKAIVVYIFSNVELIFLNEENKFRRFIRLSGVGSFGEIDRRVKRNEWPLGTFLAR